MIIKKTNVWGQFYNIKNINKRIRLMKKKINYWRRLSIYRSL